MASQYINVYKDNPTADQMDGTIVSTDGDHTAPIEAVLNIKALEQKLFTLAVRCNPGWGAPNGATIHLEGDSIANWALGLTSDGKFYNSIKLPGPISVTNKLFYVKVKASDELPKRDMSVSIVVEADIVVD